MIYFFQSLSLKTRFVGVLILLFPVLGFQWLWNGAPWGLAAMKLAGHGAGVPDTSFWYSPAALQTLFASWGPRGREIYLTVLWPTDLGLLLSYGVFLTAAMLYLLKKVNPASVWWYLWPLLPLGTTGFDLAENLAVALALILPPEGWEPVSWAAAGLTAGKWVGLALTVTSLVAGTAAGLVRLGWQKWKASRDAGTRTLADRDGDV